MSEKESNNEVSTDVQSDNSTEIVDNQEPLEKFYDDDNSDENINNQEPEVDNIDKHSDFKGKFDSLDVANKCYSELEKKLGEQSSELGELRKQAGEFQKLKEEIANMQLQEAQKKGFQDIQSYQNHKEVANFIANQYAQHIEECEFPDEMVNLLAEYRENPSDELLETIESQFSLETLKKVAGNNAIYRGQLQAQANEALKKEMEQTAKLYLDENVNKYAEDFKNPAFAALYGEAFRAYGCDLDTDLFVKLMHQFAESVIKTNGIKQGILNENHSATDEIAGLTINNNENKANSGKSLLQMSEQDLDKRLTELI